MLKKAHHFNFLALFFGALSIGFALTLKLSAETVSDSSNVYQCSYSYSDWSECSPNGVQTRKVLSQKPDGCRPYPEPETQKSCTYVLPSCSYKYSSWSTCSSSGRQSRTLESKQPEPCQMTTAPILEQTCTPPSTSPVACSFTLSDWTPCNSNGEQTRTVISKTPEGCIYTTTPILKQNCTYLEPSKTENVATHDISSTSTSVSTSSNSTSTTSQGTSSVSGVTPAFTFVNVTNGQVFSGSQGIKGRVASATSVEYYLYPVESNIPKYLGSASMSASNRWDFFFNSTAQPNGSFYLRAKIKNAYGTYESEKIKISISNKTALETSSSSSSSISNSNSASISDSPSTPSPAPTSQIAEQNKNTQTQIVAEQNNNNSIETKARQKDPDDKTNYKWQMTYFGKTECDNRDVCGGLADPDKDGLNNNEEFRLGTIPTNSDTDQDGYLDGDEVKNGYDPKKPSTGDKNDKIIFESPKQSGEVKKKIYQVHNVEVIRDNEGKTKTKISGKALPNTFITVYIYSDPIVLTVKTDNEGNWSYELDKDLGDGEHQVYVAVTDNTGKITAKSEPLAFVKTAEAISVLPPAEASAQIRAQSPTQSWYQNDLYFFIAIGLGGLALALAAIGIVMHKKNLRIQNETLEANQ